MINYPDSPTTGQIFTLAGESWKWDGVKWVTISTTVPQYVATCQIGAAPPATPLVGDLWWDNVGGQLYLWYDDGTSKQWVVANNPMLAGYLALAGGTMAGALTLAADPIVPLQAATKKYVDAGDATKLPLAGGTITGNLTVNGVTTLNKPLSMGFTLPSTAVPSTIGFSTDGVITATPTGGVAGCDLNLAANCYYDGTNWRYSTNGAAVVGSFGLTGFNYLVALSGTTNAIASLVDQCSIDMNGNLLAGGTIISNSNITAKGGVFYSVAPVSANCHIGFCNPAGAVVGWVYWGYADSSMNMVNNTGGGSISISNSNSLVLSGYTSIHSSAQVQGSGINYTGAWSTGNYFLFGWNNYVGGVATISVDNGGAVYGLANASDKRMKCDIASSTYDCLDTVTKLPLREFRWKQLDDPNKLNEARSVSDSNLTRIGMIAQEIHSIIPEAVRVGDDFTEKLGRVWDFDRNVMVSLLIGAAQQLSDKVVALTTRNDDLLERIIALEARRGRA
jgi:hypothetical protein